jgi:hypothetical protein
MKLFGIISVGFDVTHQLVVRFLDLSDTREKMLVQRDSTSAHICRVQESLWFNQEVSIVEYSHRVWGTHETS